MTPSIQAATFRPGVIVAEKYRLVRELGKGTMGAVWEAVNEATARRVARKLVVGRGAALRARLLREARAYGALKHDNVVEIYDVATTDDDAPCLVMQLLSGDTLAELIARRSRLPGVEAARIARDVARALAAAHDKGIIHRDL